LVIGARVGGVELGIWAKVRGRSVAALAVDLMEQGFARLAAADVFGDHAGG
jgi:hypothetical protein